jgi:hypothetical protein
MRSIFAITVIVSIALIILPADRWVAAQDEMLRVRDNAFENHQRPSVAFEHDRHNEISEIEECSVCHHVYTDDNELIEDESSEDMECSSCHTVENKRGRLDLIRAFHLRCKGCHQERGRGPVICNDCHRGV